MNQDPFNPNDDDALDFLKNLKAQDSSDHDKEEEEEEEEEEGQLVGGYPKENRPSRMDITKNSKENHCFPQRVTKKEMEEHVKKMHKYMQKMIILPFTVIDEYPFKKKESDSDLVDDKGKNVDTGLLLVFGKLMKWRGVIKDEYNGLPYITGKALYIKRGNYDIGQVDRPYIALKVDKMYKKIKKKDVRDLFDPVKNELRQPWPIELVDEFPKLYED